MSNVTDRIELLQSLLRKANTRERSALTARIAQLQALDTTGADQDALRASLTKRMTDSQPPSGSEG